MIVTYDQKKRQKVKIFATSGESAFPRQLFVYWIEQCRTEQHVTHGRTAGDFDDVYDNGHDAYVS